MSLCLWVWYKMVKCLPCVCAFWAKSLPYRLQRQKSLSRWDTFFFYAVLCGEQHRGNKDREHYRSIRWLCWDGGSTKLNGRPHKYSIKMLMYYLHTITSGPCHYVNTTLKVCSGPALFELSDTSTITLISHSGPGCRPRNMSVGINQVTEMILCSCWCCERGIKGAMKDQIINSGANQISHILINYSVFAGSWMHSLLILQATQKRLTKTLVIHCCSFYYHARPFPSGYAVRIGHCCVAHFRKGDGQWIPAQLKQENNFQHNYKILKERQISSMWIGKIVFIGNGTNELCKSLTSV